MYIPKHIKDLLDKTVNLAYGDPETGGFEDIHFVHDSDWVEILTLCRYWCSTRVRFWVSASAACFTAETLEATDSTSTEGIKSVAP